MRGVTKRFGSLIALDGVSFSARPGVIQAIVGENGAGKTTLMKALSGEQPPEGGSILVDGKEAKLQKPRDARRMGIGMVSQHYAIIPELTCLQNLILGDEPGEALRLDAAEERAKGLADRMAFSFDWKAPASTLSPGSAQKLEILKLLWRDSRIMILDEPTAMLSPADSDSLYDSLEALAAKGACVIVVTHRIPEVLERCADVTVLRGGRFVDSRPVAGLGPRELAELIMGHGAPERPQSHFDPGPALLKASSLTVKGDRGDTAVKGVSFEIRQGEVLGLAGVDGSGQKELFDALLGVRKTESGEIQMMGRPAPGKVADRLGLGLRMIPEDRLTQAVAAGKSLEWNAMLGGQRMGIMNRGPWIDLPARKEFATSALDRFGAKRRTSTQPLGDLSGGNQQRFVAGRALGHKPKIILAFQPTRGLDIQGTAQIYGELRRICREEGAGALVVSFDLDELLDQADRIMVMNHGRAVFPNPGEEKDRAAIGRLMVGADS
jgi:general nucleoside transport system ATP-binding protein